MAYYDMWLSNDAAQEMHDYLLEAGVHHQYLCHVNKEQGRKLFHMAEKSHYVQHIALDILSTRFNPRFAWVYADEDYMGRIAQLCKSCTRARGPMRVAKPFMFRWRRRMMLLWNRQHRKRQQTSGSSKNNYCNMVR